MAMAHLNPSLFAHLPKTTCVPRTAAGWWVQLGGCLCCELQFKSEGPLTTPQGRLLQPLHWQARPRGGVRFLWNETEKACAEYGQLSIAHEDLQEESEGAV